MATKTARSKSSRAKRTEGPVLKSPRRAEPPVLKSRKASAKAAKPAKAAPQPKGWAAEWAARNERYLQIFGLPNFKGKLLTLEGEAVTPSAACKRGWCVVQLPPRPDCLGWLYVSHGLSQAMAAQNRKACVEVALHWKEREPKLPLLILSRIGEFLLQEDIPFAGGTILSSNERLDLAPSGFEHWLVCRPYKSIPESIDGGASKIKLLMLLGISPEEMQSALRVKAELADGRKVLLQALKTGGVFPVSDPTRVCLTRRRDFNRLWETSFRLVRDGRVE
jgi:hypothetical protein